MEILRYLTRDGRVAQSFLEQMDAYLRKTEMQFPAESQAEEEPPPPPPPAKPKDPADGGFTFKVRRFKMPIVPDFNLAQVSAVPATPHGMAVMAGLRLLSGVYGQLTEEQQECLLADLGSETRVVTAVKYAQGILVEAHKRLLAHRARARRKLQKEIISEEGSPAGAAGNVPQPAAATPGRSRRTPRRNVSLADADLLVCPGADTAQVLSGRVASSRPPRMPSSYSGVLWVPDPS